MYPETWGFDNEDVTFTFSNLKQIEGQYSVWKLYNDRPGETSLSEILCKSNFHIFPNLIINLLKAGCQSRIGIVHFRSCFALLYHDLL